MHAANDNLLQDAAPGTAGETSAQNPQVRTLLLTDLCDSTMLVERLGDNAAAELFREHDRLVLGLQQRWRGRLIDRSDGLLMLFERAIDGLGFALDYARGLRELGERRDVAKHGVTLQARAGLHVGEVLTWRNSDAAVSIGAKPLEVEGLAKPMAGRLMTLARPGQILLSATAEPLAHRAARELGERGEQLLWKDWGRWRFKGVPQAQQVYEVGEPGIAPLRAPQQNRAKAWRDIPLWRRPAALAAELLLVAGLVGGAWFLTRPQPAIAFNERDWVVVGDLRNLTGDTLLDDSLEQAFRISLEQSRYVNVLSDLKARDTLGRMRRKPDTVLDRAVASEIALRDGARAVILPTVAEIGGRVRVSAEVIDPHTQTTVYAASSDGRGAGSVLGSIDRVTSELRGQLGETLESIQKNSIPLPNVSTTNLDALKAYAIGYARVASGETKEAVSYYERAIRLDPQFALAMAKAGRAYAALGNLDAQQRLYAGAAALRGRLTPREALLLDAEMAQSGPVDQALQRWREVIALYPDEHFAQVRLAQALMFSANAFEEALVPARASAAMQSPYAPASNYLVGMLLLATERYPASIEAFRKSRTLGFKGAGFSYAYAYAAQRDFDGAIRIIDAREPTGVATAELEKYLFDIRIALDRGRFEEAATAADAGMKAAMASDSQVAQAEWAIRRLSIQAITGKLHGDALHARLADEVESLRRKGPELDRLYPNLSAYLLLGAGYIAARTGDDATVGKVLAVVPESKAEGATVLRDLRGVLVSERESASGRPRDAVTRLSAMAGSARATFPVHSALARAAAAAGETAIARRESQWMSMHRGRAYVEEGVDYFPTPFNVLDTTSPWSPGTSPAASGD